MAELVPLEMLFALEASTADIANKPPLDLVADQVLLE